MIGKAMRVGVITPTPTPYRDPFWEAVSRQPDVELKVFYCGGVTAERPWDVNWTMSFQSEMMPGYNLQLWRRKTARMMWNPRILGCIKQGAFDALVFGGYNHPTMLAGIVHARRHGIPYFLMSESHLRQQRTAWKRWIKRPFVEWVVKHAAGGFPTGKLASEYLMHYGSVESKLTPIPNVPDLEWLAKQSQMLRSTSPQLRQDHNIGSDPVVLYVGRLVPKKGVDVLIRAFASASASGKRAILLIVGDGVERASLENLSLQLGIQDQVRFLGFRQPQELPKYYAMADVFVLPSSETWGVVVLEALASGLPVIVTDEVGCHPDVVTDPLVGDVVPARSASKLAAALAERIQTIVPKVLVDERWATICGGLAYDDLAVDFVKNIRQSGFRQRLTLAARGE